MFQFLNGKVLTKIKIHFEFLFVSFQFLNGKVLTKTYPVQIRF